MPRTDASLVQFIEGGYTFTSRDLANVMHEVDRRLNSADAYTDMTRVSELITQIDLYSDVGRTQKVLQQTVSRTLGNDGILYPTGKITIFYNSNGSEDSRITTTITRDANNDITDCDNVFSTTEPVDC